MNHRSPNPRPTERPLSTIELLTPSSDDDLDLVFDTLKRKHSLDHGEFSAQNWRRPAPTRAEAVVPEPPQSETENAAVPRKEMKKQKSFESIGCDEFYFYDFFDRNAPESTENARDESGPSRETRNAVRPRSWLSSARYPDETRKIRRKTDPLAKDFRSDYEEALSSLLWQPYECRAEVTTSLDDSDVGYWLNCTKRWKESSDSSSRSSTSSSSSDKDYVRRLKQSKWCKEESTSSIRGLLKVSPSTTGNVAESSDLETVGGSPLGALSTGWESQSQCQCFHLRDFYPILGIFRTCEGLKRD